MTGPLEVAGGEFLTTQQREAVNLAAHAIGQALRGSRPDADEGTTEQVARDIAAYCVAVAEGPPYNSILVGVIAGQLYERHSIST